MEQIEQPTPRDIDALLVSQGFRDLVDDARGVLTELIANPPPLPSSWGTRDLDLAQISHFDIAQLTGAICPGGEDVYRPGLWVVLHDAKAPQKQNLSEVVLEHVRVIDGTGDAARDDQTRAHGGQTHRKIGHHEYHRQDTGPLVRLSNGGYGAHRTLKARAKARACQHCPDEKDRTKQDF